MEKIKKLNLQLKKLESQKQKYKSLDNISIIEFMKLKSIISKQKKISNHLEKNISLGKQINFWYDNQNKSWIENPTISCKKYFRLDKNATYKKDLKLYKLGLIDKKPLHPIMQNILYSATYINEKLNPIIKKVKSKLPRLDLSNSFIFKSFKKLTSTILPQKFNNLAINTAKIGIKGYRKMQSNCRFVHNNLKSKKSYKYLKTIINEANKQISFSEKKRLFRESLKVSSNTFISNNYSYTTPQQNKIINKSPSNLPKKTYEYSL